MAFVISAQLTPRESARIGPAAIAAIEHFRSPIMPHGVAYALLPNMRPGVKPYGFASLEALARRIHRDRGHDALQLSSVKIRFADHARSVTAVYAENPESGRTRFIGYAWHAGRPREALQAALLDVVPGGQGEG